MKEAQALNGVAEFHHTFNMPILQHPTIPAVERCELRINLLQEELDELKQAIEDKDLTEVADALCDLQYVLSGAILEFGLGENFNALFAEVQRSNMSKVCQSLEEAEATVEHYRRERGTEGYIRQRGDKYLVFRRSDNKVLKSVNYSPARMQEMVEEACAT